MGCCDFSFAEPHINPAKRNLFLTLPRRFRGSSASRFAKEISHSSTHKKKHQYRENNGNANRRPLIPFPEAHQQHLAPGSKQSFPDRSVTSYFTPFVSRASRTAERRHSK